MIQATIIRHTVVGLRVCSKLLVHPCFDRPWLFCLRAREYCLKKSNNHA